MSVAAESGEGSLTPAVRDLSELDMGYEEVEGFSRPNWKLICDFVKNNVAKDDLSAAWDCIVAKWMRQLVLDLGGEAQVRRSQSFYCLSDMDAETTNHLLAYAETVEGSIRTSLGQAAWANYHGKHVLILFSDLDDYFAYISFYHGVGNHVLSAGIFIGKGYAHIAMPYCDALSAQRVLVHELTHNLLCHLPIPRWLNEGLAKVFDRQVARRPFLVDRELADRHRTHWNEINIQAFWAGKSYYVPGDESELSYSLGEILVNLLSTKWEAVPEFVKSADWRDAGQDAAVNILNQDLGEVLGGFLGPGNWRPQRKAIAEYLNLRQKSAKDGANHFS